MTSTSGTSLTPRTTGARTAAAETLAALTRAAIVPVIVIDEAAAAAELVDALAAGGIRCAEFTLRTEAGLAAIATAARSADPGFLVGAGTVLSPADVEACVEAGAHFVVSPGYDDAVVERAAELGVLALPGVATATELERAYAAGLRAVKFFPADRLGGLPTIAALAAPFPDMRFLPSGGVGLANLTEYLNHPAVFAVSGSWISSRVDIGSGDFHGITARAAEAVNALERATATPVDRD